MARKRLNLIEADARLLAFLDRSRDRRVPKAVTPDVQL